jgi:hypothetical protein
MWDRKGSHHNVLSPWLHIGWFPLKWSNNTISNTRRKLFCVQFVEGFVLHLDMVFHGSYAIRFVVFYKALTLPHA